MMLDRQRPVHCQRFRMIAPSPVQVPCRKGKLSRRGRKFLLLLVRAKDMKLDMVTLAERVHARVADIADALNDLWERHFVRFLAGDVIQLTDAGMKAVQKH